MSFTEWIFLLGGLGVVGPMVAHLLAKPRYRRLPFTMLRFLHAGQIESQSRRKLRDLLMLLVRCTIIVLLGVLFSRPLLHKKAGPGEAASINHIGLDNSMSMAYSDGSGSYFERMIDSAVEYIRAADDASVFNLCALARGDWASGLSKEQALAEVSALKLAPGSADIGGFLSALNRDARKRQRSGAVSAVILSDFTPNVLRQFGQVYEPAAVDNIEYKAVLSSKPLSNAAVTDAHAVGIIDGKLTLNVTVANYGDVEQVRQLTACVESRKSPPVEITLSARQQRVCQVQIDIDMASAEHVSVPVQLSLSDGDGLQDDDTFRIGISVHRQKNLKVVLAEGVTGQMFLLETAINAMSRSGSYGAFEVRRAAASELDASDLRWADVVVCSGIAEPLRNVTADFGNFVNSGGRAIFFMTGEPSADAANQLWRQQVLAALPGRCKLERTHIKPEAEESPPSVYTRGTATRSLSNYRIDKITLKGYFELEPHPDSRCLWRLENGSGFVYLKSSGSGSTVLVNTSADDSLGSVTKSSAAVAFCRYIFGDGNELGESCFACNEKVMLPIAGGRTSVAQKQVWVQTCDGLKRQAASQDSFLLVGEAGGIGWVKTTTGSPVYAGVNPPQGETDMTKPGEAELAAVINRAFSRQAGADTGLAEVIDSGKQRPIWRVVAWVVILLLIAEPAVANMLKR